MSGAGVTCQQLVELVTDYFEGALGESTVSRVEEHLARCEGCVTYVDQMNATLAALRRLPSEPLPDELRDAMALALAASGCSNGRRDHLIGAPRRLRPDASS